MAGSLLTPCPVALRVPWYNRGMKTQRVDEVELTYEQLPERRTIEELMALMAERRPHEPTLVIE